MFQLRDRRDEAAGVCAGCPIVTECADYGGRFERWGVWGGRWMGPAWELHQDQDEEDADRDREHRDPAADRCEVGHRLERLPDGTHRRRCRPCKARREREFRRARREAEQGDQDRASVA